MERRILIVDDDREIAGLVDIYLRNDGFQTAIAGNGRVALDMLRGGSFQLVIMDIMMPEMDGIELCRKLREESVIPILMLSAKAEDMDKIFGLMAGADDYMVKPFNPLELVARVKSLLRRSMHYSAQHTAKADGQEGIVIGEKDVILD